MKRHTRAPSAPLAALSLCLCACPHGLPRPAANHDDDPCKSTLGSRNPHDNGTELFGLEGGADGQDLFVAAALGGARRGWQAVTLRTDGARVVVVDAHGQVSADLRGVRLAGLRPDGSSVELALCAAERGAGKVAGQWYRLLYRSPDDGGWVNPCRAAGTKEGAGAPEPQAAVLAGAWDPKTGAHRPAGDRFTLTCDRGVVGKCLAIGYDPAAPSRSGVNMGDLHQACTRMLRADYCGDGTPHTADGTPVHIEDSANIKRSQSALPFEAAWDPDGAVCLNYVRAGTPIDALLGECPGRFERREQRLPGGQVCEVRRRPVSTRSGEAEPTRDQAAAPLLRNQSRRP